MNPARPSRPLVPAVIVCAVTVAAALVGGCSSAPTTEPTGPASSTGAATSWLEALATGDTAAAASDEEPSERSSLASAAGLVQGGITKVTCTPEPGTRPGGAIVFCRFHRDVPRARAQPYVTVELQRELGRWLVTAVSG